MKPIAVAAMIALAGCLAAPEEVPENFTAERIAQCENLIEAGRQAKVIRGFSGYRMEVEDAVWAALDTGAKRGVLLSFACQQYGRPMMNNEGVYAYGHRSGKLLAGASNAGVTFR